jgi:hypothetical protein
MATETLDAGESSCYSPTLEAFMQAILLQHVSDGFREFVVTNAAETCRAVEALKNRYAEAIRNKDYETENRTYRQVAELCCPDNPPIRIVGGSGGGYVLFDESRVRFLPHQ